MIRLIFYPVMGWGLLVLLIILYVDFDPDMQKLIQISDYLMTFHVAGYLIAHGQAAILYPPVNTMSFANAPFDRMAHLILPQMPAPSVAEYMYMPLSAAVFAPLSSLPLNISLFAWQILSIASLIVSVYLMRRAAIINGAQPSHFGLTFWLCLTLVPLFLTIWIGQVGLVFGLLPLTVGYYLLLDRKPFSAGLIWSMAIFKPQFLVPVFVILFAEALRSRFRSLGGIILGVTAIAIANIVFFPPSLLGDWLRCLKLSDVIYSDVKYGVATHLATSLPRTIILMLPAAQQLALKPIIYGFSAILLLLGILAIWWMIARAVEEKVVINLTALIGICLTPLLMPHFFFYDYSLFLMAGMIVFLMGWPPALQWPLKSLTLLTWLLINVYSIVVLAAHKIASPLLFVILILCVYLRLLTIALTARPAKADV